jgi:acyl dehydratase
MQGRKHEPLYFDDVHVGDTWDSPRRTVTETDVVNFAGLTGDYNPLHVDHEFARSTPFGKPIAHGLLGLSFVAGLGSFSPWMRTAAFVRLCDWTFLKPIYCGDTVHVRTEVLSKELKGRGRRGLVIWKRQLINQAGVVVQEGTTETLVEARADQEDTKETLAT